MKIMSKLTVLGSGTAVSGFYKPFDFRHPSGYLLEHNDKKYLIDCSEGIRYRLEKLKIDYYTIENILISHFHPDHFIILSFLQSISGRARWANEKKTINIYGPKGIEEKVRMFWDATHYKGNFDETLSNTLNVNFTEFETDKKIVIEKDFTVMPYFVHHQSGRMDAYAMRFEIGKKIFTYSGDCGPCDGIRSAAENADIFICECAASLGQDLTDFGHFNAAQVGELAVKKNVKKLVLSHLTGQYTDAELVSEVKKSGFKNEIIIACDSQTLEI